MKFLDKLKIEYPIPWKLSIWGGSEVEEPLEDICSLVESCVEELASDLLLTGYIQANGMSTKMPEGTVTVSSAMLSGIFPFQGNRLLKTTYDKANNVCYLRYYPATICYKRKLLVEDLDNLQGDQLIFCKCYILSKMAAKELTVLKTANLNVDNGSIDLSVLQDFYSKMLEKYSSLKDEILMYSTVY